jgi:glucose-1-phosphate cytidylyltransferase
MQTRFGVKAVILAGGRGTRISEETATRPKPMIEIGGHPILWHIMKIYSKHGVNDFVVCLGYRGYMIKEYFSNYFIHTSDVTFDIANNKMEVHHQQSEPWRVTLIDTGEETQTGGRLKRAIPYVRDDPYFSLTYGDGVGDVDISALMEFHEAGGKLATVTAVRPGGRFGVLRLDGDQVTAFQEKPPEEGGWINGGFFILSPKVGDYIDGDESIWERRPLERLAEDGQLQAYRHSSFWQPMDTLRDKNLLEDLWQEKRAPWRVW